MIYHLGLGGNLGDVADTMRRAIDLLEADAGRITQVSSLYETSPVGERAGHRYHNAAVELHSELTPERLLEATQKIERECGRTRTEHWGPRTLDVDILLAEAITRDSAKLRIPHPGVGYRRFVLDPLAEIAPHAIHPLWRLSVHDILEALKMRPLRVVVRTAGEIEAAGYLHDLPDAILRQVEVSSFARKVYPSGTWLVDFTADDPDTTPFRLPMKGVIAPERVGQILQAMTDDPQIVEHGFRC